MTMEVAENKELSSQEWVSASGVRLTDKVMCSVNLLKGTACYYVPWPCGRCGGRGGSDAWKFTGWTCYGCGGSGYANRVKAIKVYTPTAYLKLEAARAKREVAKNAKLEAKRTAAALVVKNKLAAWRVENDEVAHRLDAYAGANAFIIDLRTKLALYGNLSTAQVAACMKALDREAAPIADCPVGRVKVVGEVISTRQIESTFGHRTQLVTKMLVRACDGFKIWCTVPVGLSVEKGATVTFTATLERSDTDPKFGFGKRPVAA